MLLLILIFVIFLTLLLFTPKVSKQNERLHELKIEAQEYSGLNPELFKEFINNMTMFEESLEFPSVAQLTASTESNSIENQNDDVMLLAAGRIRCWRCSALSA